MAYGFNDKTYKALTTFKYYDVFDKCEYQLINGDELGSSIANSIIVTEAEQPEVYGLEGQEYIDKMVELGYIEEVPEA